MYPKALPGLTLVLSLSPPERKLYRTKTWSYSPLCPLHLAQGLTGAGIMGLYGYFVELKNGTFGELSILLLFLFYKSSLVCTFDSKFLN